MSVDTSDRKVSYTMGLSTYDFTFRASTTIDIKCKRTIVSTGVETDLVYGATDGYTVVLNSNGVGGRVTVTTAGTSALKLTIYRDTTDL